MSELYLMEPTIETEIPVMRYRESFIAHGESHINGSLGLMRHADYSEWLANVVAARNGDASIIGVPATTWFSVRKADDRIVGSIQLRHELNEEFRKRGGHIGYGIAPAKRGKGYGTQQLALVLDMARKMGLPRVMISCDRDNLASARVAMRNGGRLEWEGFDEEDGEIRIYWIELS